MKALFALAALVGVFGLAAADTVEVPPQTDEGSFAGTWYYVDPAYRIAIFIEADKTGLLTLRYKLKAKRGTDFETDAGGLAHYLEGGVPVEILFTGTPSPDRSVIEGRYEKTAIGKRASRSETGWFRIYRTSNGRSIVLHYPEYHVRETDEQGHTKSSTQTDIRMIFRKASEIVIGFDEIPF